MVDVYGGANHTCQKVKPIESMRLSRFSNNFIMSRWFSKWSHHPPFWESPQHDKIGGVTYANFISPNYISGKLFGFCEVICTWHGRVRILPHTFFLTRDEYCRNIGFTLILIFFSFTSLRYTFFFRNIFFYKYFQINYLINWSFGFMTLLMIIDSIVEIIFFIRILFDP